MVRAMTSALTALLQPYSPSKLEDIPMPELESPICAFDLREPSHCLHTAMAKPGEEIRVIVHVENNPTATQLMKAVGALINDGKSFSVVVTREDAMQQTHDS
jgi:hypothetical protein